MITNYADLQTAIAQWLHRTDLNSLIPDFIALTEEKLNRQLRTKDNEYALTTTAIVNNKITLPVDARAVKYLWLDGYDLPLQASSLELVLTTKGDTLATKYAWASGELVFDGTGSVNGVLYQAIPSLSISTPTNWLLSKHPSIYLFGALAEANLYIKNAEEATLWKARMDGLMDELNWNSQRDTNYGPLVARAR